MKKFVMTAVIALGVVGLIGLSRYHPGGTVATNTTISTQAGSGSQPAPSGQTVRATPTASLKDGTYTGQTVDVGYGPVQVAVVVSGGRITNVEFLQMPMDMAHSQMVTSMAKPQLLQETINAQSSNVDIVSGATSTSEGYIQSLQSALSQAGA